MRIPSLPFSFLSWTPLLLWASLAAATGTTGSGSRVAVEVHEATNLSFALSPDHRQVALAVQGGLYVMPLSGGAARQIVSPAYDAQQPAWSPDGRHIAFQSNHDGHWRIWIVDPDGEHARALSSDIQDEREPAWSPDGGAIAFTTSRDGKFDVFSRRLADGALTRLSVGPGGNSRPSWSPDGSQIAYVSDRPGATGVYVAGRDGGERQVADAKVMAFGMTVPMGTPTWTPDGKAVWYARIAEGRADLMNGSAVVLPGEDLHPFRMAWLSADEYLYAADGKLKRRRVNAATASNIPFRVTLSVRRPIYAKRRPDLDSTAERPVAGVQRAVLSPDAKRIAFTALGALWVMDIGAAPRRLTQPGPYVVMDPAWSPRGDRIAYASDREGSLDLYVMTLDGGAEQRLTSEPGAEIRPAWSPSGDRLAYVAASGAYGEAVHVINVAEHAASKALPAAGDAPGFPAWIDERHLLVSRLQNVSESQSFVVGGYNQAAIVDVEANATRPLTVVAEHSVGNRSGDGPVLSPDGKTYAFGMNSALWTVAAGADGNPAGAPRKLADVIPTSLNWAADSRTLFVASGPQFALYDAPTGQRRDVALNLTWHAARAAGVRTLRIGRLVDGVHRTALSDVDLVVADGRIRRISPHGAQPAEGEYIDLHELTAMPGLVDAHVHLIKEFGARFGRLWLAYGVTSVRSPGNIPGDFLEEREAIAAGARPGPRVFGTGYILDGERTVWEMGTAVGSIAEVERQLALAHRLGYDMVKTYVHTSEPLREQIVTRAHVLGLPVSSHEIYPAAMFASDSVEHLDGNGAGRGYSMKTSQLNIAYEDAVKILATSGMTVTPTISLFVPPSELIDRDPTIAAQRAALQPSWVRGAPIMSFGAGPGGEQLAANIRRSIARLQAAGATLIMGTDSPFTPSGLNTHNELYQAVRAGLTPYEALRAATLAPARLMGTDRDLGTLERGKIADIAFVEGDPLQDITNAARVRKVMTGGRLWSIEELTSFPADH
ncbi:MAG: amidohydrolase family protein [Steroidobacteraceae bacterium]